MPKSGAERNREYRRRLVEKGKLEEVKEKDKERKRRSRSKLSDREKDAIRYKDTESRRQKRMALNNNNTVNIGPTSATANDAQTPEVGDLPANSPFPSRQSRGKARKKLLTSLPKSPRKRKALIVEFAEIEGYCTVKKLKSSGGSRAVSAELVKKVTDFYTDNEISWQAPGKRDYIIVRENGNKHKI